MNKKRKHITNIIVLMLITGVSVVGFYILGNLYSLNKGKTQTVILDNSIFDNGENMKNDFQVSRFDISYPIFSIGVLSDDSLAFISENENKKDSISTLRFKDGNAPDITPLNINADIIKVSPDGKKILCVNWNIKEYLLYDTEAMTLTKTGTKPGVSDLWLPDSSGFIVINDTDISIHSLDKYINKPIMRIKDLSGLLEKEPFVKTPDPSWKPAYLPALRILWYSFNISEDAQKFYFLYSSEKTYNNVMYTINMNKELSYIPIDAVVNQFYPLNNGNILFIGSVRGYDGMYIFDIQSNSIKKIVQGNVFMFAVSPDNQKIAYTVINDKKPTELHLASFENGVLINNKLLFSDQKFIYNLLWNKDGSKLFMINSKLGGSEVYRLTFRK